MRPRAFHDLWTLAQSLGNNPASCFDCSSVGLILEPDIGRYGYDATPLNADTFATTGGDGVHFNFLILESQSAAEAPIVMTVPMAADENCNIIVGEDLIDFLSLGCRFGYFALEQLAYDRDGTIAHIASGTHAFSDTSPDDQLLDAITERFSLQPWVDVKSELAMLHAKFHHLIRLSDGSTAQ